MEKGMGGVDPPPGTQATSAAENRAEPSHHLDGAPSSSARDGSASPPTFSAGRGSKGRGSDHSKPYGCPSSWPGGLAAKETHPSGHSPSAFALTSRCR